MAACRLIVTATDRHWARTAAAEATGYGTSIIGCDAEAGVEQDLDPSQTPDGRPGVAVLFFSRRVGGLCQAVANRVGQCIMTCPTTAVFDGLDSVPPGHPTAPSDTDTPTTVPLGDVIGPFGDGHEEQIELYGRRCVRVPVMDGWFVTEAMAQSVRAVGGGNFLIGGRDQAAALAAATRAVEAIAPLSGVVTPFPGGVVRSGSKVGSRTGGLPASTNDAYCPTLRDKAASKLRAGVGCVYEIVIDGLDHGVVAGAMRAGITAACGDGVVAITAGNYNGRLGEVRFPLHEVMAGTGS